MTLDPVLDAIERAPMGPPLSEVERAAVEAYEAKRKRIIYAEDSPETLERAMQILSAPAPTWVMRCSDGRIWFFQTVKHRKPRTRRERRAKCGPWCEHGRRG